MLHDDNRNIDVHGRGEELCGIIIYKLVEPKTIMLDKTIAPGSNLFEDCISKNSLTRLESDRYIVEGLATNVIEKEHRGDNYQITPIEMVCFIFDKKTGVYGSSVIPHDQLEGSNSFLSGKGFLSAIETSDEDDLIKNHPRIFNENGEPYGEVSAATVLNRVARMESSLVSSLLMLPVEYQVSKQVDGEGVSNLWNRVESEVTRHLTSALKSWRENVKESYLRGNRIHHNLNNNTIDNNGARETFAYIEENFSAEDIRDGEQHNLQSNSYQSLRNKIQLLQRLDGDIETWRNLLVDKKVKQGIEDGLPLKKVFQHLPFASMSKRSISSFLHNFDYLVNNKNTIPELRDGHLLLEKGPLRLGDTDNWLMTYTKAEQLMEYSAVIASVPESPFSSPSRAQAVSNMLDLLSCPLMDKALKKTCMNIRDGEISSKDALGWLPAFLRKKGHDIPSYTHEISATERMINTLEDVVAFHIEYSRKLEKFGRDNITGCHHHHAVRLDPLNLAAENGQMKKIYDIERYMHRVINQVYKEGKPDCDMSWQRTSEDFCKGDLKISPITSNSELTTEGAVMNHCVGSYLKSVLEHQSYIFSVTRGGEREATLELSRDNEKGVKIVQLRGPGNAACEDDVEKIAIDFTAGINSKDIHFNYAPCSDISESLSNLSEVEAEEVETGLKYSDREFVLKVIGVLDSITGEGETMNKFREVGYHDLDAIESLSRDYNEHIKNGLSL